MKILDIQQNTSEWEERRRGLIGASDIPTIMVGSPREQYELYLEKVEGKKKFKTDAMKRGSNMEEEARQWLLCSERDEWTRPCVMNDDYPWIMASLDGYHEHSKTILEIKCPGTVTDLIYQHSSYERWLWQIQAQLMVMGSHFATEAILLCYSPLKQCKGIIHPHEGMIAEIKAKGKAFHERIVNKDPPPKPMDLVSKDEDPDVVAWAAYFREIDDKLKHYEELKAELRDQGIQMAGDQPFECLGVSVKKIPTKESIDYEAACKAYKIDASAFKKAPKSPFIWRVSA